ncbi:MAG: YfcE family phosphodiesterase [Caldimicrobium sp.]|nr:YfcE family phosphodiesterase [Caldimicrobium sp.]MCX7613788.1 YfcE family phosphodiesterase [Caldimicrobium sp.]MDW8182615.1 YfcE family phosphodiesterase [Caldimicrobium sp.]
MKVAIVSDSHDRIDHLEWAIEIANHEGAERLLHCGDLISPFMVLSLAKFKGQVDLIFGNNKGDVFLLCKLLKEYPHISLHGEEAFLELDGFKVAMVHYPKIAEKLAKGGEFDYIFCGHTHKFKAWEVGKSLIINPGELMGKEGLPSMVILDLRSREWKKFEKI